MKRRIFPLTAGILLLVGLAAAVPLALSQAHRAPARAAAQAATEQPTGTAESQPASTQPASTDEAPPATASANGAAAEHPTQGHAFVQFRNTFQAGNAAQGQELVENGSGGIPACQDCHGLAGEGDAVRGYPSLANLPAFYIYHQLLAFQDQTRKNQTMQGVAYELEQEQMLDAAAYYAQLPATGGSGASGDPEELIQGQKLYEFGKSTGWEAWMPACYLCHGRRAEGVGEIFPRLAGQHASYLEAQLKAWQQGQRSSDPNGLMTAVAAQLTGEENQALASYLSSLPGPGAATDQGGQP